MTPTAQAAALSSANSSPRPGWGTSGSRRERRNCGACALWEGRRPRRLSPHRQPIGAHAPPTGEWERDCTAMRSFPPMPDSTTPYLTRVDFVVELARRLHAYGTSAQRLEGAVSQVARRLRVEG